MMERLAASIKSNESTQIFTYSPYYDVMLDNTTTKIKDTIKSYTAIYKYIDSIYVYSEKNNVVITQTGITGFDDFEDNNWVNDYKSLKDGSIKKIMRDKNGVYPHILTFVTKISVPGVTGVGGGIVVNVDIEKFSEAIHANSDYAYEYVMIVDENNRIVFNSKGTDIFNILSDEKMKEVTDKDDTYICLTKIDNIDNIISMVKSKYYDWKCISVLPMELYNKKIGTANNIIMLLILGLFIAGLIISFYVTKSSYRPVVQILSAVDEPEIYINHPDNKKGDNEIKYITEKIIKSFSSQKEMEKELENKLELLHKSQVEALQSQINPHFLFNTLESINWSAIELTNDENSVSKSISLLSNFLRLSLESDRYITTIREEIEHVELYINILQIRYDYKLQVKWNLQDEILDNEIVKLSLQPIIENAVYHGIKPKRGKGQITIDGIRDGQNIVICITDDGIGINKTKLDFLNNSLKNEYEINNKGIGMNNVNQRIKLLFGVNYGIELFSEENKGTSVVMTIPVSTLNKM
jgi:two-component system sensor histidine kinase YesM